MKQVYFRCHIRRDAVETTARDAASTEVPVLQAIYGDALAVQPDGFIGNRDGNISPGEEVERLAKRYGMEAVMAAYGTRMAAEREIARLFATDLAALPGAANSTTEAVDAEALALLEQNADKVIEALPELPDELLARMGELERAKAKPRKTVLEALQVELDERAAEDAASQ